MNEMMLRDGKRIDSTPVPSPSRKKLISNFTETRSPMPQISGLLRNRNASSSQQQQQFDSDQEDEEEDEHDIDSMTPPSNFDKATPYPHRRPNTRSATSQKDRHESPAFPRNPFASTASYAVSASRNAVGAALSTLASSRNAVGAVANSVSSSLRHPIQTSAANIPSSLRNPINTASSNLRSSLRNPVAAASSSMSTQKQKLSQMIGSMSHALDASHESEDMDDDRDAEDAQDDYNLDWYDNYVDDEDREEDDNAQLEHQSMQRRFIHKVAQFATKHGFEWDNVIVWLIAIAKAITYPIRLAIRLLFAGWKLISFWLEDFSPLRILLILGGTVLALYLLSSMRNILSSFGPLQPAELIPSANESFTQQFTYPEFDLTGIQHRLDRIETTLRKLSTDSISKEEMQVLQNDLDAARKRLESVSSAKDVEKELSSEIGRLRDYTHDLKHDIESLDQQLETVEANIATGFKTGSVDYESIQKSILQKIEQSLPDMLPARVDTKGHVDVSPAFWEYLQDKFVAKKDNPHLNSSGTQSAINKAEVMDLIKDRLAGLESQIQHREEAFRAQLTGDQKYQVDNVAVELSMIKEMIRDEMDKQGSSTGYHPDYALRSLGARIIRYGGLTSRIYVDEYGRKQMNGKSVGSSLVSWIQSLVWPSWKFPQPPPTANPPEVIIDAQPNAVGRCWAFAGQRGVVTVMLAKPIKLSSVTLEHVSRAAWPEYKSAPKQVQIWGLSLPQSFRSLLENTSMRAIHDQNLLDYVYKRFMSTLHETYPNVQKTAFDTQVQNSSRLVSSFTYNAESGSVAQTFPAEISNSDNDEMVDIIQMRMLSNWGNSDFSCVYHIRAHA